MKKKRSITKWLFTPNLILISMNSVSYAYSFYYRLSWLLIFTIIASIFMCTLNLIKIKKVVNSLIEDRRQWQLTATYDSLTGAINRGIFISNLNKEINKSIRHKHNLSLVILDLDHFKEINDTYGHPAGDRTLKIISNKIKSIIRTGDDLGRLGGEEFGIMLPETDINEAFTLTERIRKEIEGIKTTDGVTVTISCGTASITSGDDGETLYDRADIALYESKNSGRNKTSIS